MTDSFKERQQTLNGIWRELQILNRYLAIITREVEEMNKGVEVEKALIRSDTFIINPDNDKRE